MKNHLPVAQAVSLAELGGQVAPTARSVDESVAHPTPSGHMDKGRLGVTALTASMEALKLDAPSVVATLPGTTVEELANEDMAEDHPWMHRSLLIPFKELGRWPPWNRLLWHLSLIHVRTVLVIVLRIIILVMILLKCMSNLPQWLVFYIFLYTSVKVSTHFIMLVCVTTGHCCLCSIIPWVCPYRVCLHV